MMNERADKRSDLLRHVITTQSVKKMMSRIADNPAMANGIPDDPETWDIFNSRTSGFWVIKTEDKERDIIIKLSEEEREQMIEQAGASDEKWLALMLLKEIKVIAELILKKKEKEEKEFWEKEEKKRETFLEIEKNGVTIDLAEDMEDDVNDYDY